jgi:hypothetical protein
MSLDRDSKIMLDDNTDNDSSCVSGSTSNNEENFDSYSSERCVVGNASMRTTVPVSFLTGSNGVSNHKTSKANTFSVGKKGNKFVGQTNCASSTNQNKPILSISFRDRDIARLVSVRWVLKLMVHLFTNYDCVVEDYYMEECLTSDYVFISFTV